MSPAPSHNGALCGVILAAGEGSRIRPISGALPKAALPVGNRALILHHIDALREAEISEVIIVIGASGDAVRGIVDADPASRAMRTRYVVQPERRGIAHALSCAEPHIRSDFVLLLADVYMPDHCLQVAVDLFRTSACAGVLGAKHEPDPEVMRRNFSIEVRTDLVHRVVEKPTAPVPGLKGVGTYVFTSAIFAAIRRTPISALRGEQEITDAVQVLIDSGAPVRAIAVTDNDINVNDARSLLAANLAHLDHTGGPNLIDVSASVHDGARLERTIVGPAARIASGIRLSECLVLEGVTITETGACTRTIFAPDCTVPVDDPAGGR